MVTQFLMRFRGEVPTSRSVSIITFCVRGQEAFERAISKSETWLKAQNSLATGRAGSGEPFHMGRGGTVVTPVAGFALEDTNHNHRYMGYLVEYRGAAQSSDLHFKHGVEADNKPLFSVSFCWDATGNVRLVGRLRPQFLNNTPN